jgi:hypothetical protein
LSGAEWQNVITDPHIKPGVTGPKVNQVSIPTFLVLIYCGVLAAPISVLDIKIDIGFDITG